MISSYHRFHLETETASSFSIYGSGWRAFSLNRLYHLPAAGISTSTLWRWIDVGWVEHKIAPPRFQVFCAQDLSLGSFDMNGAAVRISSCAISSKKIFFFFLVPDSLWKKRCKEPAQPSANILAGGLLLLVQNLHLTTDAQIEV